MRSRAHRLTLKQRASARPLAALWGLIAVVLAVSGCNRAAAPAASSLSDVKRAVAVISPTTGHTVSGVVHFDQRGDQVAIDAQLEGLPPNTTHGFHIHEYGDLTAGDATSAGGHYAPEGNPHGGPTSDKHHAGDLGNIQADGEGRARLQMTVGFISIAGGPHPVLGRAVIVHADPDDLESQPTGAAGARIGGGVIGIANSE